MKPYTVVLMLPEPTETYGSYITHVVHQTAETAALAAESAQNAIARLHHYDSPEKIVVVAVFAGYLETEKQ